MTRLIRNRITDCLVHDRLARVKSTRHVGYELFAQPAVDWGVAKAVTDTNPFAHTGYKLASRLLRTDQPLIESLARELRAQGTIEGDALRKWLDANASPLNFDELESNTTY